MCLGLAGCWGVGIYAAMKKWGAPPKIEPDPETDKMLAPKV